MVRIVNEETDDSDENCECGCFCLAEKSEQLALEEYEKGGE